MISLDKNKRQLKMKFNELVKETRKRRKATGEFDEERFEEEMLDLITDSTITDKAMSEQWYNENVDSKAVFNARMDGDSSESKLDISRNAQQILLQEFIHNEGYTDKLRDELMNPVGVYMKSYLMTPAPFCERCGSDLGACDKCGKKFEDYEEVYCLEESDIRNKHLCKDCVGEENKECD